MKFHFPKQCAIALLIFFVCPHVSILRAQSGWYPVNGGANLELTGVAFTSPMNGTIIAFDSSIFRTTDGGASWFHERNSVPGLNGVNFSDSLHGHIASYETVISTTDGGASWSVPLVSGVYENIRSVFFSDSATGVAIGDTSIWHFGYIPNIGEVSYREHIFGTPLDMSFTSDKKYGIISGTEYGFLLTSDSGNTWNPPALPFEGETMYGVAMLKAKSAIGLCYGGAYSQTDNGGETWGQPTIIDSGANLNAVCFPDPQHGTIIGGDGAIFHTSDGGGTWSRQESGTTEDLTSIFFLDDNDGWIVGYHGTILHTTTGGDGVVNAVKRSANTVPLPSSQDLINPRSIQYDLPTDAEIHIEIIDATGRDRIPSITAHRSAGHYTISFSSDEFPNGFYFCRLSADIGSENPLTMSWKILLMR